MATDATNLLSGLDLDLEEVSRYALHARQMFLFGVASGGAPVDAAAGMWMEGLVFGLLIAQGRE